MKDTKKVRPEQSVTDEDTVLRRIRNSISKVGIRSRALHLGIGDDAALFQPAEGCELILTCDWFLEGTHFLRDMHPPDAVGWKCLARAASDIAAMGGVPRCFLLSLALPGTQTGRWLHEFLRGLRSASRRFECVPAGGDTTQRKEILINIAVIGEVRSGTALLRSRAKPGDVLFVSGMLGEAEFGLRLLRRHKRGRNLQDPLLRKHLYPEPRFALGRWLAEKRLASAMMDLSDGLSADLPRLCAASNVGARIRTHQVPSLRLRGRARRFGETPGELALHGGDDYELLFTVPKGNLKQIPRSFHRIPLTAIGEITKERRLLLVDAAGKEAPLANRGWDPFRKPS